jgi:hypothetical protein
MAVDAPKASGSTRMSVYYLTAGTMLLIWPAVWLLYMTRHTPSNDGVYYLAWGLLFTGAVLSVIGLTIGHIGRVARNADVAPAPAPTTIVPTPVAAQNVPMMAGAGAVPLSATANGGNGTLVGGNPANVPIQRLP